MTDLLVTITGTETVRELQDALEFVRLERLDRNLKPARKAAIEATVSALCDAIADRAMQQNRLTIEYAREQGMGA